ncbi:hypothetical protein HHI36_013733, partial [Cryptolaemus montrouzieri]
DYTANIKNYQLVVPHKLTTSGEFVSFHIPHFFKQSFPYSKRKRSLEDDETISYGINFLNKNFHVTLWPNHEFLCPNALREKREPKRKIKEREIEKIPSDELCHFVGIVRGVPGSRAAFSTCNGL